MRQQLLIRADHYAALAEAKAREALDQFGPVRVQLLDAARHFAARSSECRASARAVFQ